MHVQVYKGKFLKQLVAIKVLTDNSPEQQEAFREETMLLRDLRHPRVVQYLGHTQLNGNVRPGPMLLQRNLQAYGCKRHICIDQTCLADAVDIGVHARRQAGSRDSH